MDFTEKGMAGSCASGAAYIGIISGASITRRTKYKR